MSYENLKPWEQRVVDAYSRGDSSTLTNCVRTVRPDMTRPDVAASKLMAREDFRAAILERQKRTRELSELSEKWVLERLRTVVERCMSETPMVNREGEAIGIYRFDSSGATKALELIGRHFAMFTDKIKAEVDVTETLQLGSFTMDELQQIAQVLRARLPAPQSQLVSLQ